MSTEPKQCGICLDKVLTFGKLNSCEHDYHFRCIKKWSKTSSRCPNCRVKFSEITHQKKGKILKKIKVENDFIESCFVCGKETLDIIVVCQEDGCENMAHNYCIPYDYYDYWFCDECRDNHNFCDICNKIVETDGIICGNSGSECEGVAHLKCLQSCSSWKCKGCENDERNLITEYKNAQSLNEEKYCKICDKIIINRGSFCSGLNCLNKAHLRCLEEGKKKLWNCKECFLDNSDPIIAKNSNIKSSKHLGEGEVLRCENTDRISGNLGFRVSSKEVSSEFDGEGISSNPNLSISNEKNKVKIDFPEEKSGYQLISQSQQFSLDNLKDRDFSCNLGVNLAEICELPKKKKFLDSEMDCIMETVREWVRSELVRLGDVKIDVEKVFRGVVKVVEQNGDDLENRNMICKAVQEFVENKVPRLN